jgi:hypothetical protein
VTVFSGMWWGVWGTWFLLWAATAASAAGLCAVLLWEVRREGRRPRRSGIDGTCVYLHETTVMYHYESRAPAGAQREEIEEKTGRSSEAHVDAGALSASLGLGAHNSREVVRKYLQEKKGTLVIRPVVAAFERDDAIVHIDLIKRLVERNPASVRAATAQRAERRRARGILLRNIEAFVLIKGHFREVGRDETSVTYMAPYGDPEASAHGPQIRIGCATEWLIDKAATGFRARCLGEVQEWNAEEGVLDIEPMALFRY